MVFISCRVSTVWRHCVFVLVHGILCHSAMVLRFLSIKCHCNPWEKRGNHGLLSVAMSCRCEWGCLAQHVNAVHLATAWDRLCCDVLRGKDICLPKVTCLGRYHIKPVPHLCELLWEEANPQPVVAEIALLNFFFFPS